MNFLGKVIAWLIIAWVFVVFGIPMIALIISMI